MAIAYCKYNHSFDEDWITHNLCTKCNCCICEDHTVLCDDGSDDPYCQECVDEIKDEQKQKVI